MIKHATASVMIYNERGTRPRKVVLLEHPKLQAWMPPGGHVEGHENCYEAAIRETLEETGLDIAELLDAPMQLDAKATQIASPAYILEEFIEAVGAELDHFHVDHVYVVRIPEAQLQPEAQYRRIGWFSLGELDELRIFGNVRGMITEELRQ